MTKLRETLCLIVLLTVTWLPIVVASVIWWTQDNYKPGMAAIWFSGWSGQK